MAFNFLVLGMTIEKPIKAKTNPNNARINVNVESDIPPEAPSKQPTMHKIIPILAFRFSLSVSFIFLIRDESLDRVRCIKMSAGILTLLIIDFR